MLTDKRFEKVYNLDNKIDEHRQRKKEVLNTLSV